MARILYVEDNDDNVYMLRNRLERRGFEVLVAGDGRAGVEAGNERPPESAGTATRGGNRPTPE